MDRDRFARRLRHAIEEANDRIFAQSRDNQNERGMGTTCTAVGLVDGTLVVGQIGDSRCYVMRGGPAGPGHQGPVAGLAADGSGRHDRRGGQGLRARQHHPAGAGRAGAGGGGDVAGRAAPGRRRAGQLRRPARPGDRRGDPAGAAGGARPQAGLRPPGGAGARTGRPRQRHGRGGALRRPRAARSRARRSWSTSSPTIRATIPPSRPASATTWPRRSRSRSRSPRRPSGSPADGHEAIGASPSGTQRGRRPRRPERPTPC